ncbi:MAG: type II toxin-antitoxin system VapC family toxin [Pseudomonadota bacterium]|nr:type II toxin-antitoxin system VapC family toxin [Pseudomonadota bacterium]
MIGIDTNILLRYLVEDEPEQTALAVDLIENRLSAGEPGFIAITVVAEMAWILKRRYRRTPAQVRTIVEELLKAPQIVVERSAVVQSALELQHPDLADAIICESCKAAGCEKTETFDRAFARLPGAEMLSRHAQ